VDVAGEFVQGENVMDDVKWRREVQLDALAQELVELHDELQELLLTRKDTDRVQHLGEGVYVQRNKLCLDTDSEEGNPATITREESRNVVNHSLDALGEENRVCVTGQPGIGKTRGCMMYAMQSLLNVRAAVLYAWSTRADKFSETFLALDSRVVSLIDPPEQGPYTAQAACRVLKFASNNAELHFRNWEKDGVLLVTSMPTAGEVTAMTPVLWDDDNSPHPWQYGIMDTMEEKKAEIKKRNELVEN